MHLCVSLASATKQIFGPRTKRQRRNAASNPPAPDPEVLQRQGPPPDDAIIDPDHYGHSNRPLFQRIDSQTLNPESENVQLFWTPHKGWGLFARRRFAIGETILREAALVTSKNFPRGDCKLEVYFDHMIATKEQKKVFEKLSLNSKPVSRLDSRVRAKLPSKRINENKVFAIFKANAVNLGPSNGYGVYQWASRINHTCQQSNCTKTYDHRDKSITVKASTIIDKGQELLFNYFPELTVNGVRITKEVGFTCRCDSCEAQRELPTSRQCFVYALNGRHKCRPLGKEKRQQRQQKSLSNKSEEPRVPDSNSRNEDSEAIDRPAISPRVVHQEDSPSLETNTANLSTSLPTRFSRPFWMLVPRQSSLPVDLSASPRTVDPLEQSGGRTQLQSSSI